MILRYCLIIIISLCCCFSQFNAEHQPPVQQTSSYSSSTLLNEYFLPVPSQLVAGISLNNSHLTCSEQNVTAGIPFSCTFFMNDDNGIPIGGPTSTGAIAILNVASFMVSFVSNGQFNCNITITKAVNLFTLTATVNGAPLSTNVSLLINPGAMSKSNSVILCDLLSNNGTLRAGEHLNCTLNCQDQFNNTIYNLTLFFDELVITLFTNTASGLVVNANCSRRVLGSDKLLHLACLLQKVGTATVSVIDSSNVWSLNSSVINIQAGPISPLFSSVICSPQQVQDEGGVVNCTINSLDSFGNGALTPTDQAAITVSVNFTCSNTCGSFIPCGKAIQNDHPTLQSTNFVYTYSFSTTGIATFQVVIGTRVFMAKSQTTTLCPNGSQQKPNQTACECKPG